MTLWAGTLQLCQDDLSVDYISPHSRRHSHVAYRGAQHSDLLPAQTPAQALAQKLSAAFHRIEQVAQRLGRRKLPNYGHLHALVHLYGELQQRYYWPDIQNGPLQCAEPPLRAALQTIEYIYWSLAGTTVHQPLSRSRWTRRSRQSRPQDLHGPVLYAVQALQNVLRLRQSVQPRTLRFGGGGQVVLVRCSLHDRAAAYPPT
jgi:hypothetical protein